MIHVERLCKNYSGAVAIKDISFSIEEGEIIGLLGLNGAGKSTILKILGCFLMPSSGSASISGFSVEDQPDKIRELIGYLPDTPPLYGEMTVRKYLAFVARLKNVAASATDALVDEAIGRVNLGKVADTTIQSLSHGYRQRVGIAQAIVHKPKVLILDEPINGLDPVQIVEMRDLILSFRNEHTVILSSHILSEITRTCDRILIVDQGCLVAEGNQNDLQEKMDTGASFRMHCEVKSFNDRLLGELSSISGVKVLNHASLGSSHRIELELMSDERPQVARALVDSGLLAMNPQGDALENLFMKFVRS